MSVSRPLLRYLGGKWRLAPWIIAHFPPHEFYTEAFAGSASVLLRKPRCANEILNDMDGEVVSLFRVLRSDRAQDLIRAVALTPFCRRHFEEAYEPADDPVEAARRLIFRSFAGHGGALAIQRRPTGFRAVNKKSGSPPASPWRSYPDALAEIVERLRGVVIENRPAVELLTSQDHPKALHYVDPPYLAETRTAKKHLGMPHHRYNFEMSEAHHHELLAVLRTLKGRVVLSGYASDLYDETLKDWWRRERETHSDGGHDRTEVIWMNFDPAAAPPPHGLFADCKAAAA